MNKVFRACALATASAAALAPVAAFAEDGAAPRNIYAIAIFLAFITLTLFITRWAATLTKSQDAFFTASGGVPAWQNGLAIAGDFMSAATFLGITGLMFAVGYDAYILSIGILIGWPIMLMLICEPFRNLGKFTFVDVVTFRFDSEKLRLLAGLTSLTVVVFYLIGQMVGAGKLIELLFGIDYAVAIIVVTALMISYVYFGGMLATTWVQMVKAGLLLAGGFYLCVALLAKFGFSLDGVLMASASTHPSGDKFLAPGGWLKGDFFNATSVALTMCFGIMGLPHILMRFFTVRDAAAARKSVTYATLLMVFFYGFILVIGFGSVALIWENPAYYDAPGVVRGGGNLIAIHLADALGGDVMLGFMSAVTFATILAVVAGLALAGSAAISHDILPVLMKDGGLSPERQLQVSRLSVFAIGAAALLLGLLFETQNIAVVTAVALAVAASVNFPILIMALHWGGMTARGAIFGGLAGLGLSFILIVLSKTVWVDLLGAEKPIFPYVYPTIAAMPTTFLATIIASKLDKSAAASMARARYAQQKERSLVGVGAAPANAEA
ncbi:MAG: cation acetate symporter [Pseudomonadota bacterium]